MRHFENWILSGVILAVVALAVLACYVMVSDTRRVGTSMLYHGETVVLVALQHETTPRCYLVRRADGSTMLVPINEMIPTPEKR